MENGPLILMSRRSCENETCIPSSKYRFSGKGVGYFLRKVFFEKIFSGKISHMKKEVICQ